MRLGQMREGFRLLAPDLAADADWVLVGRAALRGRSTADVMEELRRLARKGDCLRGEAAPS